jgi:hypothetical protein
MQQTWNLGQLIQLAVESHPSVRVLMATKSRHLIGIETAEYQKYPTPQRSYESVKKYGGDTTYIGSDGIATVRITQPTSQPDNSLHNSTKQKPIYN